MSFGKTLPPTLILLALPLAATAHGTMEVPISRVYGCYKEGPENPKSAACIAAKNAGGTQAMYDWNGVNQLPNGDDHQAVVPDGTLCGGGQEKFKGFNLARGDWPATAIAPDANGNFEFVYNATAPHATKYFRYYVTKDGWNPQQALKWSDLVLFYSWNGTPPLTGDKRYKMSVPLPKGKTGQHIIYTVWKRSDSQEAFYACSDVKFPGSGPTPPLPNPWKEVGQVTAHEDLPAGSTATLRIFGASGQDVEKYTVTLDASSGKAVNWPYELGSKVNRESSSYRIGVYQSSGTITPVRSASANRAYEHGSYQEYNYAIDLKKPTLPPTPDTWQEGVSYTVGQIVSYQGKRYRCLQAHTAWAGAGWTPTVQAALWQAL